jgi:hypothetical protein
MVIALIVELIFLSKLAKPIRHPFLMPGGSWNLIQFME